MATTTSAVYIHIIEDVINKVKDELMNSGIEENAINEIQGLWELKMMQRGAIFGPIERSSLPKSVSSGTIAPVHDLNVPYEGIEEYETPTAEILFPPTPLETPIQTPLPGTVDHSLYHHSTPSDYPALQEPGGLTEMKPGRPSPYMQSPAPWMNQRPLGVDVNVAYVEGREEVDRGSSYQPTTQDFFMMSSGKRKREDFAPQFHGGGRIPQQDGAGDATPEVFLTEVSQAGDSLNRSSRITANDGILLPQEIRGSLRIPQQDGPITETYEDLYPYQGVANEDYNTVNTPASHELQAVTPNPGTQTEIGDDDDDEPPLNENDDDDFDDVGDIEEPNMQQLVLAQFDKVTRTKSKWKCTLKDGIMRVNNKDILFSKATGEFDF